MLDSVPISQGTWGCAEPACGLGWNSLFATVPPTLRHTPLTPATLTTLPFGSEGCVHTWVGRQSPTTVANSWSVAC